MSSKLYLRPCDEPASLNMLHHIPPCSSSKETKASSTPFPFLKPQPPPTLSHLLLPPLQPLSFARARACLSPQDVQRLRALQSDDSGAGGETLREHGKAQARYMRFPRCSQPNPQSTQWRRLIGRCAAGMPTAQQSHDGRPRAPSAHLPHLRAHWGGSVEQKRYSGGRDARY